MLIKILLIGGLLGLGLVLFFRRNAKQEAIVRLLVLAFALFAILTVLFPGSWSAVARFLGVGRGADLLLYATVLALLGFITAQQIRFRRQEERFTVLARRIALDEARLDEARLDAEQNDAEQNDAERGEADRRARCRSAASSEMNPQARTTATDEVGRAGELAPQRAAPQRPKPLP